MAAAGQPKQPPDPQVAVALFAVKSGLDPKYLAPEIRAEVAKIRSRAGNLGLDPDNFEDLYFAAHIQLKHDALANAVERLAETAHRASMEVDDFPTGKRNWDREKRDWHREWGFSLISRDHPRFREGKYLVGWNQEALQNRSLFDGRDSNSKAKERFETLFTQFVPNLKVLAYAGSGSDAVNLCFDIARQVGNEKSAQVDWNDLGARRPVSKMAFFDGVYGGGRGEAVGMNNHSWAKEFQVDLEAYRVPSPTTRTLPVKDPAELERLQRLEKEALAKIRALAQDKDHPIGAIFIEPIQGANGVLAYRTEFMLQLRDLADELELPIIADEVLTSGGRTGKFFGYQHYEGFEPDFVVFGKGMQVNGVAEIQRANVPRKVKKEDLFGGTTADGNAADLHKATQVLTIIRDENLIERAAQVGKRLERMLGNAQEAAGMPRDVLALGCLAGWTRPAGISDEIFQSAEAIERDRLMPPLNVGDDVLDQVEAELMAQARGAAS